MLLLVLTACSQSAAPVETGVRGWDGEEVTEDDIADWSATPSSIPFDESGDAADAEPAASAVEITVPTTSTTVVAQPDDPVADTTTTEVAVAAEPGSGDQMVWLWAPW